MSAALKPAALVQLWCNTVAIVEAINGRVAFTVMSASEGGDDEPYKPAESVSVFMDTAAATQLRDALNDAIATLEARALAEATRGPWVARRD